MRRSLFIGCLLFAMIGFGQMDREAEVDLETFAERIFQFQDEDVNYEDIYESLLLFYTDPLNLNKADEDDLGSLYVLSPVQINSLLDYLKTNGDLLSIYELQAVENMDLQTIDNLLPFVSVDEITSEKRPLLERIRRERNKYFIFRHTKVMENQRGYNAEEENGYTGSPDKLYGRFRASARNDFSAGFTFEKDNGESLDNGFDFYSLHLMLENQGPLSKVLVGDFQMQAGQGLVFGAGFNAGKGAETVNTVKRNTVGIRPYTSVLESGFFRGVAASAPVGDFEITAFFSSLNQDGNVQTEELEDDAFEQFVSSIQTTGFHRTHNEISSKNKVLETSYGGMIEYKPNRSLRLGVTGLSTTYSSIIQRSDATYNFYEFNDDQNTVIGAFGSYQWQNLNFFGEGAQSSSGGRAMVGGLIATLSKSLDMAVSLRDYDRDYHSFYGNAFGEGSRTINEKGIYWGLKFKPSKKYSAVVYYDKFQFPWLRFRMNAPAQGAEWLGRFTYRPDRSVTTYIQVREERKEVSITDGNLSFLTPRIKRNYILNIDYGLSTDFSMKTRVQTSTQNENEVFTKGYAIIQDLNYSIGRFRLSGRMALFETDDYDNRQYSFEKDVLYAFSIPAYNGVGVRNYFLVRFRASSKLDLWARYGRYAYTDRDEVGLGMDVSQGATRSEVKFMLRWKL